MRSSFYTKMLLLSVVVVCMFFGRSVFAQFESGVNATVFDSSGAAVPGATITLTNQATHVSQHATANGQGYVQILQLPIGTYTVVVTSPGFKTWQLKDIVVEGNNVRTIYPKLAAGAVTEEVTITADTQQIETTKGSIGRTLETATLAESPMLGQNIYSGVATLAPGVTGLGDSSGNISAAGSLGTSSYNAESGYQINAAGQRQEANEYQVDGTVVDSNSRDGVVNITPHPETVQEMKVTASMFSAEKGRQSGALIELFTKSGTNKFHGMVSEFHNDNWMDTATHFEKQGVPKTIRNDFGGAIGGPIWKDKTFFFGSLFWERSVQGEALVSTVETAAWRNYVKTKYPNAIGTQFLTQAPAAVEPTSLLLNVSQVKAQYGGQLTTADFSDFTGNVLGQASYGVSPQANGFQGHVRFDHNMKDSRDKVFFSFFRNTTLSTSPNIRPVYAYTNPNKTLLAKFDYVHTFSPSLVNEVGVSFVRNYGSQKDSIPSLPNVYYVGGISSFSQWGPSDWTQNNFIYQDNVTWQYRKHSLHFGLNVDRQQDLDNFENGLVRPYFYFINPLDFATDLPFYQGGPVLDLNTHAVALNLYQRVYMLYTAPYVQDDWKVTPRLTVNLGVRLDYFGHQDTLQNGHQNIAFFTPSASSDFNTSIADGTMQVRAANGAATYGPQFRFAPRLGFAWDILGNGKMSLHGGYGLYSNKIGEYGYVNQMRTNPPGYADPALNVYSGTPRSSFSYSTSNSGATGFAPPPGITFSVDSHGGLVGTRTVVGGVAPNLRTPMVHSWGLGFQRAIWGGWVFEADYFGTASRELYIQYNVNRYAGDGIAHNVVGGGNFTYLNQSFGSVEYGSNNNIANSEVAAFAVAHSFSHGWTAHATYTIGKSLDYISSNDNGVGGGESVFDAAHPERQYGRSDYDSRHRLSVDAVWNIPATPRNNFVRTITEGWVISPIVILQSGQPFTVYNGQGLTGGGDYNADGNNYDMPNAPAFGRTIHVDRSKFLTGVFPAGTFGASTTPAAGTEGNLGRNTYDGPGFAQVNLALARKFRLKILGDAGMFEIRGEAINAFNRVNLTKPISDLTNSQFGMSTGQLQGRICQVQGHIRF